MGTRPLGMAGALRSAATGDAAVTLNPSGMSLVRSYVVEGAYQNTSPGAGNAFHASIVDTTSDLGLGGALYYTYAGDSPAALRTGGHEGGFALAAPLGDRTFLGGTVKYLRETLNPVGLPPTRNSGLTFDAGITMRPIPVLSVGLVGYNLKRLDTSRTPRAMGLGTSLLAGSIFLLAFDGVMTFDVPGRDKTISLMGGGEVTVTQSIALRGGGGRDGIRKRGFASGGISLLSEVGALDFGFSQDVSGSDKATVIGLSLRFFVPSP